MKSCPRCIADDTSSSMVGFGILWSVEGEDTGWRKSHSLLRGEAEEASMRHPVKPWWSRPLVSLIFVLILLLSACALNTNTTSTPDQANNGGGGSTPTPQQPTTCQDISGFGSAQSATAGAGFGDVS